MDIEERIEAAIERITCGFAPMRVPADFTDPDLVLVDCLTEIRRLRGVAGPQIPEGYVLAPVAWTSEMRGAFVNKTQGGMRNLDDGYAAMLAARPEVP